MSGGNMKDDSMAKLIQSLCNDIKEKTNATDVIVITVDGPETRIHWNAPKSHEALIPLILEDVAISMRDPK